MRTLPKPLSRKVATFSSVHQSIKHKKKRAPTPTMQRTKSIRKHFCPPPKVCQNHLHHLSDITDIHQKSNKHYTTTTTTTKMHFTTHLLSLTALASVISATALPVHEAEVAVEKRASPGFYFCVNTGFGGRCYRDASLYGNCGKPFAFPLH